MIGHNILYAGNAVDNNGAGGVFGIDLPNGADKVVITIKDATGAVVRTINMGANQPGTAAVSWDGSDDQGTMTANGSYKFDVKATIGSNNITANALSYAQVESISNEATGLKLNLSSGDKVSTTAVKEIF
jgi:flagellar basal-body rod modification protein FlgD